MTNLDLIGRHVADTGMCSVMHHAKQVSTTYNQIIEKGWDIVPDILYYLEEYHGGMHVMMLLMDITGERPYKPEIPGHWKVGQCRQAWIEWGKNKYSKSTKMANEPVTYKIKKSLKSGEPTVSFTIGVQTFTLQGMEDEKAAEWYIKQLKTAFENLVKWSDKVADQPVSNASAHNKGCNGCIRHKRDVMITMTVNVDKEIRPSGIGFHDYFLTTEQAISLRDELNKVLKQNEDNGKDTNS